MTTTTPSDRSGDGPPMTRSERIRAACERFAEGRPDEQAETVDQGIEAALDAALADMGGLDGLALDADDDEWQARILGERDELRADRDRLRDALREIVDTAVRMTGQKFRRADMADLALAALRDSEAGGRDPEPQRARPGADRGGDDA